MLGPSFLTDCRNTNGLLNYLNLNVF